jgi:hypothetical protein
VRTGDDVLADGEIADFMQDDKATDVIEKGGIADRSLSHKQRLTTVVR